MRWKLPEKLREISGLAVTADQRLLAVTDEEAIVYELDVTRGGLVKAFALGEPTVRDDFEGIAVLGETVWLMNSDGDLYASGEGVDGERMSFKKYRFPFKDDCELEGLTADAQNDTLIMVCKDAKRQKDRLIFEWSEDGVKRKYRLPESEMADSVGSKRVHPSGIVIDPESGALMIVAARENSVFSVSRTGEFLGLVLALDARRHQQAEGLALTADGAMLVADEAVDGPAMLTRYDKQAFATE